MAEKCGFNTNPQHLRRAMKREVAILEMGYFRGAPTVEHLNCQCPCKSDSRAGDVFRKPKKAFNSGVCGIAAAARLFNGQRRNARRRVKKIGTRGVNFYFSVGGKTLWQQKKKSESD